MYSIFKWDNSESQDIIQWRGFSTYFIFSVQIWNFLFGLPCLKLCLFFLLKKENKIDYLSHFWLTDGDEFIRFSNPAMTILLHYTEHVEGSRKARHWMYYQRLVLVIRTFMCNIQIIVMWRLLILHKYSKLLGSRNNFPWQEALLRVCKTSTEKPVFSQWAMWQNL